jgi:hypothetical protein
MKRLNLIIMGVLIVSVVLAGCNYITFSPGNDQSQIETQSASIIEKARQTATAVALETQLSELQTQVAQPSATPQTPTVAVPTATWTPTATPTVTRTPLPTLTLVPSFTQPPTVTPIPCNAATFVADVTIPDGTVVGPSTSFTKIWRIRNTGTCTWTTSYSAVFVSGEKMGASSPTSLTASVSPNDTIDITIAMTAPSKEGKYRGSWKLSNANGSQFGIGGGSKAFFVDIEVKASKSNYAFDFVGSFCAAQWSSGAGNLPCPGSDEDSKGFVLRIDNPILETGSKDDEPVLLTNPQAITDGVIRGKYPSYKVVSGDHFRAILGCAYNAKKCDVKFQLDYQIGDDAIKTLTSWNDTYNDKLVVADVDLSSLAGSSVKFILTVFANGEMNQDRAQWLAPRILHK